MKMDSISGVQAMSSATVPVSTPSPPSTAASGGDDYDVDVHKDEDDQGENAELLLNAVCISSGVCCAVCGIIAAVLGIMLLQRGEMDAQTAWVPIAMLVLGLMTTVCCGGCAAVVLTLILSQGCVENCGHCMEKPPPGSTEYHVMDDQIVPA